MADMRTIDELKATGADLPAPESVTALYRQAFRMQRDVTQQTFLIYIS
jgi:hypothetical protein